MTECFPAGESVTTAAVQRDSFIRDMSEVMCVVLSAKLDSEKTEKLTQILVSVDVHIVQCFANWAQWNQTTERFEGAPDWEVLAEALERLRDEHSLRGKTIAEMYVARPAQGLQNLKNDVASHRQRAADILLHLTERYHVTEETLVHALVLSDRYISSTMLPAASLCSLESSTGAAVACLMIAMKLRDVVHPLIQDLSQMTSIECQQLLHFEALVLQSLEWDICAVSGDSNRNNLFLRV
jgi:hypothetical protein